MSIFDIVEASKTGLSELPNYKATNPALIDSALRTEGYGKSSAGEGGVAARGLSDKQKAGLSMMASSLSKMGDTPMMPITKVDLSAIQSYDAQVQQNRDAIALSTKKAKVSASDAGLAMQRGARGENPIDSNGVTIKAYQELLRRYDAVQKSIDAIKARRAKGK